MTENERDSLRRADHDLLIELRSAVKTIAKEQAEQGQQISDLYDRVAPITQWIGTANVGVKALSYLGVIVVVVSLLWNGVATGISAVIQTIAEGERSGQQIVLDPESPAGSQVRRSSGKE